MNAKTLWNWMRRPQRMARKAPHWALTAGLAAVLGLGGAAAAQAAPATSLLYGTLATSAGGPAADGTYAVTVSLYKDAQTQTALWTEQGNVSLLKGQFSYVLGANTPLSPAALTTAAFVGIKVGSDAELPRNPLNSKLFAMRATVAEAVACSGCIAPEQLDSTLQGQSAIVSKLSDVAKSGLFTDVIGAPDLSGYLKKTDLKPVATTGAYTDLADKPVYPVLGKSCGSGLVVAGFKADGSLDCVTAGVASLPKDSVAVLSNNLIYNTFVDKTAGKPDVAIPDGLGAGVTDTLTFPSIGIAQKIWFEVSLQNSDISGCKIELYGPSMLNPYVLYQGGKTGTTLTAKFNDDTPLVSGDPSTDWVGKDIAGNWSMTVKDLKAGGGSGGFDGKINWSVNIQTLSSKKIEIKGSLIVDGSLTAAAVIKPVSTVYWVANFNTYDNGGGTWYANNDANPFGGVNPSAWTDGNATAANIADDFDALRSIFNRRRAISPNSIACAEIQPTTSSTNGRMCGALFRIQNTTGGNINWTPYFYYTSYYGWSERSSVTINASNVWNSNNDTYPNSNAGVTVTLPAGKTSTVIIMASSSPAWGNNQRDNALIFYNNSLTLPSGLKYVDDLDTATGKWKF